jgi:DNA-binding transcriptional MerR regulator
MMYRSLDAVAQERAKESEMQTVRDSAAGFNIRAVVNETGLKADTIRAWERRYGLPKPARSAGGHRQYSARDVQIIKWLMDRQEEGLTISNAVDLWNGIMGSGQDPLLAPEYLQPLAERATLSGHTIDRLRGEWVSACLEFNESNAERALNQAFAQFPVEAVCAEVLQAGLRDIGDGWYRRQASVQQEHFASELAMRRLENLVAAAPDSTPDGGILVVAPPGEQHTFSLLLITLLLRRHGRGAIFLGANVPLHQLDAAVEEIHPQLAILSAQQLPTAASLLGAAELLNRHKVVVAYGGGVFNRLPGIRDRVAGHFLGETIATAPAIVEVLLSQRPAPLSAPRLPEEYRRALQVFEREISQIEARVYPQLVDRGEFDAFLRTAVSNTALFLRAALILGDLSTFRAEIDWIHGLLQQEGLPEQALGTFLHVYARALEGSSGSAGRPVAEYLFDLAASYQPQANAARSASG